MAPFLIRGARQLLTLRGPAEIRREPRDQTLGVISDGAILISSGIIDEVGPWRRVGNLAKARKADEIDASGCVVMPGFVDALADLAGENPSERAVMKRAATMLRHGTTAVGCPAATRKSRRFLRTLQSSFLDVVERTDAVPCAILTPIESYLANHTAAPVDGGLVIASGFRPSSPSSCSLQAAISIACQRLGMSVESAITAATVNGACAIGLGSRLGTLETGKQADVLILDVPDYREIPYHFGMNLVREVIKRGRIVYRQGEVEWAGF
ncbi:MAG: amidohydrolase family protein [Acidobacteria bacterium]|nr:amidohydrolase family protein [Acidobacteriota bacterium]